MRTGAATAEKQETGRFSEGAVMVRQLRQKLGFTQEELAHELAVTVSTVNRWENGHAEPSKLALKALRDLATRRTPEPATQA